ncbi:uncharacterized protein LOC106172334 [Lingula anatina]|uniref:Uncharacterized protein LOC106172334 n=1 Tax=Lingula anatina TaxID=7574 RepID=A0A1S3JDE2_LINAN|nr:uncharacterized protein LOC106172334 [Lingula anatina]|eukprot:XP_013408435.1 uncharacterized protein LOC106172334 [Lingula anatina]
MEGRCKSNSNKHQSLDSGPGGSSKPYLGHGTDRDNRNSQKERPKRPKTSKTRTKGASSTEVKDTSHTTRDDNANVISNGLTPDDSGGVVDSVADNLEQSLKLTESVDAHDQNNPDMHGTEPNGEAMGDDAVYVQDGEEKIKTEEGSVTMERSSVDSSDDQEVDDSRLSRQAVADDEENIRKFEEEFDPKKLSSSAANFDSKAFTGNIQSFIDRMQSDSFARVTLDFPANDLQNLTAKISSALLEFRNYTLYSQSQLEELRNKITEVKENVTEQLHTADTNAAAAQDDDSDMVARKALEAKLARLHADIAETGVELAKTAKFSAETEKTAIDASLVAEHAVQEAERIKAEMEENQRLEEERKQLEIARKVAEEKRKAEEEERRAEEEAEKMRLLEEKRKHDKESKKPEEKLPWEDWPLFTFRTEGGSFDQGIASLIRTDGEKVRENSVQVQVINPLESSFPYEDNEELVSNIINVTAAEDCKWKEPIYVAIPHCMSRTSALSREPVVKAEVKGKWKEIPSYDMHFEHYKDVKFVQTKLHSPACLAVVTRFKKDHLHVGKKGGKIISSVDPRITFNVEPQTFSRKENIQCQVQPVDSASVADIKLRFKHCRGLLTSSAIINMKWDSEAFGKQIIMTLPCPPNPVKARKAAAIKAEKEAKMKQPERKVAVNIFDAAPKKEPEKKKPEKKPTQQTQAQAEAPPDEETDFKRQEPTRWYMGQYGGSDDDENDNLFLLYSNEKGKWHAVPDLHFSQIRLDLLEFELREPLTRFMVLRTRTTIGPNEAVHMAASIESYVESRLTQIILKQKTDDPNEIIVSCVPAKESDKALQKLNEEGYEEGPGASSDIIINEGDVLEVRFRGNIKSEENKRLRVVFNSHLKSTVNFYACELDQYLQKSFPVFKGFAQIYKRVMVLRTPQPSENSDGDEPNPQDLKPRWEEDWELVSELLVTLPKEHVVPSKPIEKAPIRLINTSDPVTEELLRRFAEDLGDEWKRLAHYLNVRRTRVQAILRNNDLESSESKEDQAKYDMLMTWVKRVPKGMNKVSILSSAFLKCGRRDLAEELRDIEHDFLVKKNKARQISAKV